MTSFRLHSRKKRMVFVVPILGDVFIILDANTEECLCAERFASRDGAIAHAKSKGWRVV